MKHAITAQLIARELLRLEGRGCVEVASRYVSERNVYEIDAVGPNGAAGIHVRPDDLLLSLNEFTPRFLAPLSQALGSLWGADLPARQQTGDSVAREYLC